jgi:hypothetical protein
MQSKHIGFLYVICTQVNLGNIITRYIIKFVNTSSLWN